MLLAFLAIERLKLVKSRKSIYFAPATPESAETFLFGFRNALTLAGIPMEGRVWTIFERRGWKMDSCGVIPGMRAKGLTEDQIMDELFDSYLDELRRIHDAPPSAAS